MLPKLELLIRKLCSVELEVEGSELIPRELLLVEEPFVRLKFLVSHLLRHAACSLEELLVEVHCDDTLPAPGWEEGEEVIGSTSPSRFHHPLGLRPGSPKPDVCTAGNGDCPYFSFQRTAGHFYSVRSHCHRWPPFPLSHATLNSRSRITLDRSAATHERCAGHTENRNL